LIAALANLDLVGERVAGQTGVWVGGRKIASMGIHVKQWVTLHGFALNVHPDLSWFQRIIPCGIAGVEMTSVAAERQAEEPATLWAPSRKAVIGGMAAVFDLVAVPRSAATLPVSN